MAIKGEFTADFSSFQAAVEKANVTLNGFEANSRTVESSLTKMSNALNGSKMIADATLMAEAVDRIGGVTKLTEDELQRLGAQAADAAEKMKALGMDVPANLQAIADKATAAQEPVEGLGARITGIVQAAQAAIASFDQLVGVVSKWVTAANEQEDATVRMTTALKSQGTYTPELVEQYAALATEFETTTVNADELNMQMMATLATVGGVAPKDMRAALQASADLAAGLRIDLTSATNLVAKALEGNTTALHKHGIEIDAVALSTQGATAVFDAIAAKMGGQAAAQAATFGGEMQRLGNVINNVEETLGGFIASALKPLIDDFLALPEPVRDGAVALGLLTAAAIALAAAITGIAAAWALAAPVLGMAEAGTGAVALGGLATAAGTAATAFGPLAIAIGAVWAAWEIGNTETVTNGIATWALSSDNLTASLYRAIAGIQQMTPEQARTAVAATAAGEAALKHAQATQAVGDAHTTTAPTVANYAALLDQTKAKVAAMTDEQKAQALAYKELGASAKDLEQKFGLNAAAMQILTSEHQAAEAAAKKHAAALAEIQSAGTTWQDTLAKMDQSTVAHVKELLAAGVATSAVAEANHLAETQVKAFEAAMKDSAETLKKIAKLEEDNRTKQEAGILGLSKLDQEASQKKMEAAAKGATEIEKVYGELRDYQMKTTLDTTTYEVMKTWATADEKIKAFKGTAEQVAQYADLTYQDAQNKQDAIYDAAYDHYKHLNDAILVDVVDVANKIKGLADDTVDHVKQATQQLETLQGGVKVPGSTIQTYGGTNYLVAPNGNKVALGPHGELPDNYLSVLAGTAFPGTISNQPRIGTGFNVPSYAEGGYGDFGSGTLALLHGLEAIVPLDTHPQAPGQASLPLAVTGRPLGGGAAPVVVNIDVTQPLGTPQQIAEVVGQSMIERLRQMGIRTAA